MKLSVRERILAKILEDATAGCWNWQGYKDVCGYGRMGIGKRTSVLVHRAAWEAWGNPLILIGYELHHLCDNKACCNPSHLQMVTKQEHLTKLSPTNIAFKAAAVTHCPFGHEYPSEYVVRGKKRARLCKPCAYRRVREFYLRHPEKRKEKMLHDSEQRRNKRKRETQHTSEVDYH